MITPQELQLQKWLDKANADLLDQKLLIERKNTLIARLQKHIAYLTVTRPNDEIQNP